LRAILGNASRVGGPRWLGGTAHEIAPQTERLRLFEPAPAQLPGQTYIDTDSDHPRGESLLVASGERLRRAHGPNRPIVISWGVEDERPVPHRVPRTRARVRGLRRADSGTVALLVPESLEPATAGSPAIAGRLPPSDLLLMER
jgi:hypothetical protein